MRVGETKLSPDVELKLPRAATAARPALPEAAADKPKEAKPAPEVAVPRIDSVTRQIDTFLRSSNRSLQFRVDDITGRTVVSICDAETGEVIRQVPGDQALEIAQRIEQSLSAFLDETA